MGILEISRKINVNTRHELIFMASIHIKVLTTVVLISGRENWKGITVGF